MSKPLRHRNIWKAGEDMTFGVSRPAFQKLLDVEVGSREHAILLYLYLVSKAESSRIRLHTGDILVETGMSRPTFLKVRAILGGSLKLIAFRETGSKGVWEYELFTADGNVVPTFDNWIDFNKLSSEDIEAYYASRLKVRRAPSGTEDGKHLLFDCPFHTAATPRKQCTLQVTVDGGSYHGRFICNNRRCRRLGGLVRFEMAMNDDLAEQQAARAVRAFFSARKQAEAAGIPLSEEMPWQLAEAQRVMPTDVTI